MTFDPPWSVWRRVAPASQFDIDRVIPADRFFLKPLSNKTLWLRLPDFDPSNKAKIDSLLTDNAHLLKSTPNLVIDVRWNKGGSDASYDALMAWIYTRPIYMPGVQFRATKTNADAFDALVKHLEMQPNGAKQIAAITSKMRANLGEWVSLDPRGMSIRTYPEIKPMPKRVGILITGAMSSGDQFVLDARASRKVTTFGGNTSGVIDYSNQVSLNTPSGKFALRWPISRSMRLPEEPLDNVGVPPDLRLDEYLDDPIGAVQDWLERQTD